jgi:predicted dehydrogenase
MRPLRIGVAGLGFGAAVHAPVLARLPGVQVVAIAGSTRVRAQQVADKLGIAHGCAGIEELLDQDIHAVSFALPPRVNESASLAALERGLPLLCEKPIAQTLQAARAISLAGEGRLTAVDFQFAELSTFKMLREIIRGQEFGRVLSVDVRWEVESFAQRNRLWSWKTDAKQGGGVLSTLGAHLFFLAEWLIGPVITVEGTLSFEGTKSFTPPEGQAAPDRVEMTLGFVGGARLSGRLSNTEVSHSAHSWTILCERATLKLINTSSDYMAGFVLQKNGSILLQEDIPLGSGRAVAFERLATRFITAARLSESRCMPDVKSGARVQELLDATLASGRSDGQLQRV